MRPSAVRVDVVATKVTPHGTLCVENNIPGVAVKTKEEAISAGIPARTSIAIGEKFNQIVAGVVQVDNAGTGAPYARGDAIYIIPATNVVTNVATANVKVGRVEEIAGERQTPTGKMRVNLDLKD